MTKKEPKLDERLDELEDKVESLRITVISVIGLMCLLALVGKKQERKSK